MTRPTVVPDWATTLSVDPTSGQNNRVEPPTAWKTGGWGYQEKPARNYDNFMKWLFGQWIQYLDTEAITRSVTYVVAASDASAESKLHADAVCDGTDDHTEINAAITAVSSTGGVVYLTEGTFTIDDTINMASGVRLIGSGQGITTIEIDTAAHSSAYMISAATKSDISIEHMTLDGKAASVATNDDGIHITAGSRIKISNVTVKDISYSASSGRGFYFTTPSDLTLEDCTADGCEQEGFLLDGTTEARLRNCKAVNGLDNGFRIVSGSKNTFTTCVSHNNDLSGFFQVTSTRNAYIGCVATLNGTGGTPSPGIKLGEDDRAIGCEVNGQVGGDGIQVAGNTAIASGCRVTACDLDGIEINCDESTVSNCIVTTNDEHGIRIDGTSTRNLVIGCFIAENGKSTDATFDGITITSSATENTISNNRVQDSTSGNQQRYGINVANTGNYIYGNDLVSSGKTGTTNGTSKTIPQWVGTTGGSNASDDITKANRIA